MTILKPCFALLAVVVIGALVGCSITSTKSADVSDSIRTSLDQAGLKEVSVSQDRDKGVVTLSGKVGANSDKMRAEALAKSFAGSQVVSNQIAVIPPGNEANAKSMNSSLDDGIESNLKAVFILNNLQDSVNYAVKNHVVTLTGEVDSQSSRSKAAEVAAAVPNVRQVVNELQVMKQKATSSM